MSSDTLTMKVEVESNQQPTQPSTILPTKNWPSCSSRSTALPRIASDFNSFSLQGWVATSFVLVQSVFLLFFWPITTAKWILVSTIGVFELGEPSAAWERQSVRCFVRDWSTHWGRLHDHVTWRWCLFINLPIGGISLFAVTFLLKAVPPLGSDPTKRLMSELLLQVQKMDWGHRSFSQDNSHHIRLWERFVGDGAMAPLKIRTILSMGSECFSSDFVRQIAIIIFSFLIRFTQLLFSYASLILACQKYISDSQKTVYSDLYQVVRHHSAIAPGSISPIPARLIVTLPLPRRRPPLPGSRIGPALLYRNIDVRRKAHRVPDPRGYRTGLGMQNAIVAIQSPLTIRENRVEFKDEPKLIGQAQSVASFGQVAASVPDQLLYLIHHQFLGGMMGLSVAEPVFASMLTKYLVRYAPDAPVAIAGTHRPQFIRPCLLRLYLAFSRPISRA
ncbi:hypothetical protein B0H10DRAFT_1969548 [Mycena sp. CBHHK59/15]|nr:hypothetical protein B0H10DRAFT_1969548 [Mycena sp. CBHHK59/15]